MFSRSAGRSGSQSPSVLSEPLMACQLAIVRASSRVIAGEAGLVEPAFVAGLVVGSTVFGSSRIVLVERSRT